LSFQDLKEGCIAVDNAVKQRRGDRFATVPHETRRNKVKRFWWEVRERRMSTPTPTMRRGRRKGRGRVDEDPVKPARSKETKEDNGL
jgi:hypothetical protein